MAGPGPTDDALLAAWAEGDKAAAADLIARHCDDLFHFFVGKVGADAEDLMQQTLVGCLEHRHERAGIRSFRAFLFGVARNRLIDHFRRSGGPKQIDPSVTSLADAATLPSQRIARRQEERLLLEALRRIPLDSQLILESYYWHGLTGSELADAFRVPEGTVRGRIRRAKQQLTEQLERITQTVIALDDTLTRLADWKPERRAKEA